MNRLIIFACALVLIVLSFKNSGAQEKYIEGAMNPKQPQTIFSLDSKGIQSFSENSINITTGDVSFTVPLANLVSKAGLSYALGLSYNSNVEAQRDVRNLESPTGVVGLGWAFPVNKIIVDNKGTVSLDDDVFYWVSAGGSQQLTFLNYLPCIGSDGFLYNSLVFSLKNNKNFKFTYDPVVYEWRLNSPEGIKYFFGGRSDIGSTIELADITAFNACIDHPTNGNSVEWGVCWGNWIGESNTIDQNNYPTAWNLVRIENQTGDFISFNYQVVEEFVGSETTTPEPWRRKFTKSCYLNEVNTSTGKIKLFYGQKTAIENIDPHQEGDEPDAYQERAETHFLDKIEVYNNDLIFEELKINYRPLNAPFYKRLISSIEKTTAGYQKEPSLKFKYFENPSQDSLKIQLITYPTGGTVEYTYEEKDLSSTQRNLVVYVPQGYIEPRVWTMDDYTLVTFFDGTKVKLLVYEWSGEWLKTLETEIDGITKSAYYDKNYQTFEIFPSKFFFTVLRGGTTRDNFKRIYLFHKKENEKGWVRFETNSQTDLKITGHDDHVSNNRAGVANGDNFSFIYSYTTARFYMFVWKNGNWVRYDYNQAPFYQSHNSDENNYEFYATALNNLVYTHNTRGIDKWQIFYLDQNRDVKLGPIHSSGTDIEADNYSDMNPSRNTVFEQFDDEIGFFNTWDISYSITEWPTSTNRTVNGIKYVSNYSDGQTASTLNFDGAEIVIGGNHYSTCLGLEARMYQYSGNHVQNIVSDPQVTPINFLWAKTSVGSNMVILFSNAQNYKAAKFLSFNPNTNSFSTYTRDLTSINKVWEPKIGLNFWASSDSIYIKEPSSTSPHAWSRYLIPYYQNNPNSGFVVSIGDDSRPGSNFWVRNGMIGIAKRSSMVFIKNGIPSKQIALDNGWAVSDYDSGAPQLSNTVSNTTVVTFSGDSLFNSSWISLHRIVLDEINGSIKDRPVTSVKIKTGFQEIPVTVIYNTTKATTDPSGFVALYHKVTVRQGTDNGYSDIYINNGIPSSKFLVPLVESNGSNELSNLELLKGNIYRKEVHSETGALLSVSETKYLVSPILPNYSYMSGFQPETGFNILPVYSNETTDGQISSKSQTYNVNGLLKTSFFTNSDGKIHKSEFFYASDLGVYSDMKNTINFDPVIQTVKWVDGKVVSSETTTWKLWGTYWAPNRTFIWKYKPSQTTTPVFNFSAWSENSNPQPSDGWVKTSEILSRTSSGLVLSSQDLVGSYQSTQYQGGCELPVSSFKFAKYSDTVIGADASFLNFEGGNLNSTLDNDYWSFPGGSQTLLTQAEAHTGDLSLQVKGKISGGTRTLAFMKEFEPTETKGRYLVTFWYKTETGYSNNSAKLIFHVKGTGTDTTNTSTGFVGSYVSGNKNLPSVTGWTLVQSVLDLKAATGTGTGYRVLVYLVNNDANQKSVFIDDVRFSPLLSESQSTVFNLNLGIPVATIDNNNETRFPIFNPAYQMVTGQDEFGVVKSFSQSFFSRAGNSNDEFQPTEPNSTISLKASDGGVWYHFNNGNNTGVTFSNISIDTRQLKHTTLGTEGFVTLNSVSGSDFAVRFNVKNETALSNNPDYRFSIGTTTIQRDATGWRVNDVVGYKTIAAPQFPLWTDWLVVVKGPRLFFFADGKTIFQITYTSMLSGTVKFTFGANTQGRLDDIIVFTKPQLGASYSDGIGRTLQSQILNGDNLVVEGSVYDSQGRPALKVKPAKYTTPDNIFGYKTGYITNFNWSTGAMTGDVLSQYPADGGFPYSRTEYEASPLNRTFRQGRPGPDVNLASGKNPLIFRGNQCEGDLLPEINNFYGNFYITESKNDEGTRNVVIKDQTGKDLYSLYGPLKTYNKVLSLSKNPGAATIYPRATQTITWQAVFGTFGDDPPAPGEYRKCTLKVGTTPGGQEMLNEVYVIPGVAPENVTNRSGALYAEEGVQLYITITTENPDGGNIDCNANFTYQEQDFIISKTEYDDRGKVTAVYTPNYFKVPFTGFSPTAYIQKAGYDAWGRKIWGWTMESDSVRYLYDNSGRIRFQVDAKSENTRPQKDTVSYYKYDKIGRLLEEGFFLTDFEMLDSLKANNPDYPLAADNPKWKTQYSYDGELNGTTFVLASRGNLIKRNHRNIDTEASGSAVQETFVYNAKGFIQTKTLKVPAYSGTGQYSTNYTYNSNNQVTQIDYPTSSLSVRYAYDDFGRVTTVGTATDADYFAAYSYDLLTGRIASEQVATAGSAAQTISYAYNPEGLLNSMTSSMFNETLGYYSGRDGDNLGYYDGKIASVFNSYSWVGSPAYPVYYTLRYKYDKAGRLTTANYYSSDLTLDNSDIGVGTNNETAYDMNGNILKLKEGAATAQQHMYYSGRNQIKNINGSSSQDYLYDQNGNMSRTIKTGISKTDFVYDTHSQASRKIINLNNSGAFLDSTIFTADGINRRVLKSFKNAANIWYTLYLHGSSDNIMEERYRTGAAGTETIRQYIYGPTGLIAIRDNTTDYFVLKDHLGSTRVAFNGTTGAVVAYFDYSPFGKTARSYESGTIVKYTYTGQEKDPETGLMNYKARMYDPNIGRFYTMDPAGQTPSFYNYCGNNPVSFTDPTGELFGIDDAIIITAFAIGATINVASNWDDISKSGGLTSFTKLIGYATIGGVSGAGSLFGGGIGLATAGFANGYFNANMRGVSGIDALIAGGVGAISGFIGGSVGSWATKNIGGVVINGTWIATPGLKGAVAGALAGGVGGYAGGFTAGFLTTGSIDGALEGGASGFSSGVSLGGILGAANGIKWASDNKINQLTGKPDNMVVVGRGQDRNVDPTANSIGAETITKNKLGKEWPKPGKDNLYFNGDMLEGKKFNKEWCDAVINGRYSILDRGGSINGSINYQMELRLFMGNENYWKLTPKFNERVYIQWKPLN